jgi:DNA primase
MISDKTIRAVLDAVSLVDVIAESTELKRQGANYTALCPFHSEKTPSFHVRSQGNRFHCFGCHASGDVINFVMRQRGIDFPEAVRELAGRVGIAVEEEQLSQSVEPALPRAALYHVTALAQTFFQRSLKNAPQEVYAYIQQRGITSESIDKFGIGFCPTGGEAGTLHQFLTKQRIDEELMIAAGVVKRSQSGRLYDIFRGRLIFPVFVDSKRIAGFGGRVIPGIDEDRDRPKYLNSPETPLYRKHSLLYGLPQAGPSIRSTGEVYIVEGYLDVVAFAEAGVTNVVACCGTALGNGHLKTLESFSRRVILLFDGDNAGREAAGRSFERLIESRLEVFAAELPEGEDPDTFVRGMGSSERPQEVVASLPRRLLLDSYLEWHTHKQGALFPKDLGPSGKAALVGELKKLISQVDNPVVRDELVLRAGSRLNVSLQHLVEGTLQLHGPTQQHTDSLTLKRNEADLSSQSDLPRLDQDVIRSLMALRDPARCSIHRDPAWASALEPRTLAVIASFEKLFSETLRDEVVLRDRIKDFLRNLGQPWIDHWRKAVKMRDKGIDFTAVLSDCQSRLKRCALRESVREIDDHLRDGLAEEEQARLALKKLELLRAIQSL